MENASDVDDCCIICLKTSDDSQLISVEAKTAGDINKLFYVEFVDAGSGIPQICITCLFIVEKAANLKDCLQKHGKFFKSTREKVQEHTQTQVLSGLSRTNTDETPANLCPECSKITRNESQSVESRASVDQVKQLTGVEITREEYQRYDQVKTEVKIEDTLERSAKKLSEGVSVTHINEEVNEDNDIAMMSNEGGDTSSSDTADLNASGAEDCEDVVQEDEEAETSVENVDIEMLFPTTVLIEGEDHAFEIELGKSDAMYDNMNNSRSERSSKEVARAGLQQNDTVDELTCHCGFKAASAPGLKTHQTMKGCKSANLQIRDAPSKKSKTSLLDSIFHADMQLRRRSLPSDRKQHQKRKRSTLLELESDEEDEMDSSIDVDDDKSSDYVARSGNSAKGGSSRFSMRTRRRRPQGPLETVDELTCYCGFRSVSAPGLKCHQTMKGCKSANLQIRNAPSYNPIASIPGSETEMDDEEDGFDDDDSDDKGSDYVANFDESAEGCSTSGFSMVTRSSESEDEEPVKIRKMKKPTSRRSKGVVEESEESEESDDEPPAKKNANENDDESSNDVSKFGVGCMGCRRNKDPEQTLLCDECNSGWHMFCLNPKLTVIPQGDWFCPRCRPYDHKGIPTRKRRQQYVKEETTEEEELTNDDTTADSDPDESSSYVESEDEQPIKMRKVEKQTVCRSTRVVEESEGSEESDDEPPAKKNDGRSSRRVSKSPRRYSPELDDPRESRRRSCRSRKFVKESTAGRRAPKRSCAMLSK